MSFDSLQLPSLYICIGLFAILAGFSGEEQEKGIEVGVSTVSESLHGHEKDLICGNIPI